jgi:hypothetical protein
MSLRLLPLQLLAAEAGESSAEAFFFFVVTQVHLNSVLVLRHYECTGIKAPLMH